MTDLADMDRKAKHNQLIKEGYCILPKVAPPRLIKEIRELTDELIDALTLAEQERYRLRGSLIEVLKHSSMAELIPFSSLIKMKSMFPLRLGI
jgi:c-di-GMP-related signal transduction protein